MNAALFLAPGMILMVVLPWGGTPVALAQEAVYQEIPTPSSVQEEVTPLERSFIERIPRPGLFPLIKRQLKDTAPFFRDTELDVNLRSYYFYRDKYDDKKMEAWAYGGALAYRSGWYANHLQIGAVGYLSEPIYAPDDRGGSMILDDKQNGYSSLGQAYTRVRLVDEHYLNLGRYEYNTPFINKNDSRMTPNTFQGYTYQGASGGKDGAPAFRYGGGYIDKIKERNSTDFEWMSKDAGAPVKRGVAFGGGILLWRGFSLGAMDYYSDDLINIGYAEAKYTWAATRNLGFLFSAQYIDQRSVGEELLSSGSFSVNQVGMKTEASYLGAILSLAFTTASSGADLQNPWSGYPGYTSVQINDFNGANEKAFLVRMSYDFTRIGLQDVAAYALFVHGWDKINPVTKVDETNDNEWNFDLQWKPRSGPFKAFWPRLRYAVSQEQEGKERYTHDVRLIFNYDFPLL